MPMKFAVNVEISQQFSWRIAILALRRAAGEGLSDMSIQSRLPWSESRVPR